MAEPFIGEIKLFSYDFPPRGWVPCDGRLLAINQNQALFSLLGTTFGGNGTTTFAVPDLRGRVPMHPGAGTPQGAAGGVENVTLASTEMPAHSHAVAATSTTGTVDDFENAVFAAASSSAKVYAPSGAAQTLSPDTVSASGGSEAHTNCQPSLVVSYCIAAVGIYPSRN